MLSFYVSPTITEGLSSSRGASAFLKYQNCECPPGTRTSAVILGLSLRGTAALIEARLASSVYPDPGTGTRSGRRGRGEKSRRATWKRNYQCRTNRRAGARGE